MTTYGDMQNRIADEVLGTGAVTTTHITNAIQDAIKKYERRRFYFNEVRYDESADLIFDSTGFPTTQTPVFKTVAGVEYYDSTNAAPLATLAHIDRLILVQAGVNRYPLRYQSTGWADKNSVTSSWKAMPTDWTWVAGKVRLYPIPDIVYPILIQGTARFSTLVNTTDSNPWMTYAEELIRCCACAILYRRIIRDNDMAQVMAADEAQALQSLLGETLERGGPRSFNVKSYF